LLSGSIACQKPSGEATHGILATREGQLKYALIDVYRHEQQHSHISPFLHLSGPVGVDRGNRYLSGSRAGGLAFFINWIRRPKLVITPHLDFPEEVRWGSGARPDLYRVRCKFSFEIANNGKNSARLVRFEIRVTREDRQIWLAPNVGQDFPIEIGYRNSIHYNWFSQEVMTRYSGDDYEYHLGGEHKPSMWMFKKTDRHVAFPVNTIHGAIYGDGGLKKEFSAMIYVTGDPKQPFLLKSLSGCSELPS